MTELLVVSWGNKPFRLDNTYTGTKEEICNEAEESRDCMYRCNKEEFIACIDAVIAGKSKDEFHDKWHGLYVSNNKKFDDIDDLKTYIKRRYGPDLSVSD